MKIMLSTGYGKINYTSLIFAFVLSKVLGSVSEFFSSEWGCNIFVINLSYRIVELFVFFIIIKLAYTPLKLPLLNMLFPYQGKISTYKYLKLFFTIIICTLIFVFFLEFLMGVIYSFVDHDAYLKELVEIKSAKTLSMSDILFKDNILISSISYSPIVEEFIYRSVIFVFLLSRLHLIFALLGSAIIFGVAHANPISAGLMGIFLALVYFRLGNLILCITAHMVGNAFMILTTFKYDLLPYVLLDINKPQYIALAIFSIISILYLFASNRWFKTQSVFLLNNQAI